MSNPGIKNIKIIFSTFIKFLKLRLELYKYIVSSPIKELRNNEPEFPRKYLPW
jgi:hypothetical protein